MKVLINASDIKIGGGIQVTDSICCTLKNYQDHFFVVVLSSYLSGTANKIEGFSNVKVVHYDLSKFSFRLLLLGRDKILDNIVSKEKIDIVLSVFGPSLWVPQTPMLSGFARAHILMPESPYFKVINRRSYYKECIYNILLKFFFKRSTKYFYTENPAITERLKQVLKTNTVFTVTNSYHQVFDREELWKDIALSSFSGFSFLTVTAPYPHKNLGISIEIAKYLINNYPGFNFRFVFTIRRDDFPLFPKELDKHFVFVGPISIEYCPSLYEQCDVVFQPTLLECFTATYPEAMRMRKPIVTTNLEFAKGLCSDAACYYSAIDAQSAAEALYSVCCDKGYAKQLVLNGAKRLALFDNYDQRSQKIIALLTEILSSKCLKKEKWHNTSFNPKYQ